ncbi:MAG: C25 family cysteine peptidase [Thermoplasmatota archaeon]
MRRNLLVAGIMTISILLMATGTAYPLLTSGINGEGTANDIDDTKVGSGDPYIEFSPDGRSISIRYSMDMPETGSVTIEGVRYDVIDIGSESFRGEVGRPILPSVSYMVPVLSPDVDINMVDIQRSIMTVDPILPLQEAVPDVYPQPVQNFIIDSEFYRSPGGYPERNLEVTNSGNIGDIHFVKIDLIPVSIIDDGWTIEVIRECAIEISWNDDPEPAGIHVNDPMIKTYERIFNGWDEFRQMHVRFTDDDSLDYREGCEYLIITAPGFMNASQTLASWKNGMGIMTKIYDTDQTGRKARDIRSFIQNAYDTWSPRPSYVLLMGDAEFIPTNYMYPHSYHGKLLGTDHWYSTVNGTDYYSDLFIGRMPVNDPAEAMMVVNKTIGYEMNPPDHIGFYENITLAAYFQDSNYDGYADRRFAQTTEETMAFIESEGYTGERIYYASSSVNPRYWNSGTYSSGEPIPTHLLRSSGFQWDGDSADIDNAIERGTFLVTHRDHGASWGWGDPRYTTSNIPNLDNGDLLPVVFSINCLTGMMDHETANDTYWGSAESFSERFLTREGGGAVGVVGATRVSYSGYNDYFYKGLYDAIYPNHTPGLGNASPMYRMSEVMAYGKYYMANTWGDTWGLEQLEFELFHYFGDPAMEIWTSKPSDLAITHPADIDHGTTMVRINTSEEDVMVCISQNGRIIGRNRSHSGHVNITTPPLFSGKYQVTATGHDLLPSISSFNVSATSADLSVISIHGPGSGTAGEKWTCSASVMNTGGVQIANINVTLNLDDVEINRTSVPMMAPGGSVDVEMNWTPRFDGMHQLSVKAESAVSEISEGDNEAAMDVRIFGDPDMIFDHVDALEFWGRTGEITAANFSLGNGGYGDLEYSVRSDMLFHDDFESDALDPENWVSDNLYEGSVDYALNVPSGSSCLSITSLEYLESQNINLSGYENLTLAFKLRKGGFHYTCEPYDRLTLSYLDSSFQSGTLYSTTGKWNMEGFFSDVEIDLPADALHRDFRFRFQSESTGDYYGDGPGRFYIDDISLYHGTGDHHLSVSNGTGRIGFEELAEFTLITNGTSLPVGIHNTSVYITTNDPDIGSFPVNVSVEIRENVTPAADAGSDIVIGQHETVILDGGNSTDNTGITNWTWKVADHDGEDLYYYEVSRHTFHEAGVFTVELTVHDYALNFDHDLLIVTVLDTTDPTADAGSDITADQHEVVQFNGSGSADNVGIADYTWRFDYGSSDIILNGPETSFTFHEAGEFTVNLSVKDEAGNEDAASIVVTVRDTTLPDVRAGIDLIVDQHEAFLLNGSLCSDNVGIANWTWTIRIDDEQVVMYGMLVEYSIPDVGTYQAVLNASDGADNFDVDTVEITVRDVTPPEIFTQGNVTMDQFSTHQLNASLSSDNVEIANFTWTISIEGDTLTLYGKTPSLTIDRAGVFDAVVSASDHSFNSANSSFTITVIDREMPIIRTETELTIDQHQDLILDATSSSDNVGIDNFTWTLHTADDTILLYGAYNKLRMDEAGSYDLHLNVSDTIGNRAGITIEVTVRDTTPPTVVADSQITSYAGNTTVFDASSSSDNVGIESYEWSFRYNGQDIVLHGEISSFVFEIPGIYNITLRIRDLEGNENSSVFSVIVIDPDGGGDGSDDDTDSTSDDGIGVFLWLVIGVIAVLIILILITALGLLLFARGRSKVVSWEE